MIEFELTLDQKFVFDQVIQRITSKSNNKKYFPDFNYITIGGLAGTGKTFLISVLRGEIKNRFDNLNVAFATFTGKASSVLKNKLTENNVLFEEDFVGTIHSLIYKPEVTYDKNTHKLVITKWVKKQVLDFNLIIIDEASMVTKSIWDDLLSYQISIIAVGDYGQLPPIGDKFNLMFQPDYLLKEIKRQSLNNPIIRLSQDIKNGKEIPYGFYDNQSKDIFKLPWNSNECKKIFNNIDFIDEDTIVLCGLNKTRVSLNQLIRNKLGFNNSEPYPGDRIIFLKNNYETKVLNGMLGKNLFVLYNTKEIYEMTISLDSYDDSVYSGLVYSGCFGKEQYQESIDELSIKLQKDKKTKDKLTKSIDFCDFGYCISVHKSQGSEFKKVICFIEKSFYWDDEYMKKWLYTAVTRAKEKVFLITP